MDVIFMDVISHHGIKGMKWGVRRTPEQLGHLIIRSEKVKIGDTPAKKYTFSNKDGKKVAEFKTWKWWDGINISDLEVYPEYRGKGYSYELLDYATKKLGVKNLAVKKNNTIAKHVYDKYGFKTTVSDEEYYYMSLSVEINAKKRKVWADEYFKKK